MAYPKGTVFKAWYLYPENQRGVLRNVIKRHVDIPDQRPKIERLPVKQYVHFRDDPKQLGLFLERLNAEHTKEQKAINAIKVRLAYLNEEIVIRYEKQRLRDVPSQGRVQTEIFYLRTHFLNYFPAVLNLKDPKEWYAVHKDDWAEYLLSSEVVPDAPATKRDIIQAANRFMAWLHNERPTEVPLLVFKPISKARFKDLTARWKIDPNRKRRTFIKPKDWEQIVKNLTPELFPFAMLGYHYGARRSELLGFRGSDVKKGHLIVERTLETLKPALTFAPTKGGFTRTTPHWFSNPQQTFRWIEQAIKYRVDADALSQLWKDMVDALGFKYDLHDLRHSFVTRALREGKTSRDVQLAVGHVHNKTTMGYAHDDRDTDGDDWQSAG